MPGSNSSGEGSGENGGAVAFDPLKTPKMLNYLEKLSEEGYAVFVGDGRDDDEKNGKKKSVDEGKAASEEGGSLVTSLKERVAQVVGGKGKQVNVANANAGARAAAAADAALPQPPSSAAAAKKKSGSSKKKGKKGGSKGKKGAKRLVAKGQAGGKNAAEKEGEGKDVLDYTRFDVEEESDGDDNDIGNSGGSTLAIPSGVPPEEYPEELRGKYLRR